MKRPYTLTKTDCARLRELAPLFDIQATGSPETGMEVFNPATMKEPKHFANYWVGHYRLLTEICSATIRLIKYDPNDDESCAEALLRRSDGQLKRIAELEREYRYENCQRDSNR